MKKTVIAVCSAILLFTACISFLSIGKNDLQAVFSCLRTALDRNAIYAIENTNTDNCFILQTDKKTQVLRLYRRDEDDVLTRYTIHNAGIDTAVVGTDGWVQKSTVSLPYTFLSLLDSIEALINEKSENTDILESYVNLALSSFSSVHHHSSQFINYTALAENIQSLFHFLSERNTKKSIGWKKELRGAKSVLHFYPFADENINREIMSAALSSLQPEIQEQLSYQQPLELPVKEELCIELTTFFGRLDTLLVYQNEDCVFSIRKLK